MRTVRLGAHLVLAALAGAAALALITSGVALLGGQCTFLCRPGLAAALGAAAGLLGAWSAEHG